MSDQPDAERPNPMVWLNEEAPEGVFVASEPNLNLLGIPSLLAAARPKRPSLATASEKARMRLDEMAAALQIAAEGGIPPCVRLDDLSDADLAMVRDVLGEGEVSVLIAGPDQLSQASETMFPGLWLVAEGDGAPGYAEVADAPAIARQTIEAMTRLELPLEHIVPPDGTMNVMGVLAEIRHFSETWTPGRPNHVLNFTLLPMTEADARFLALMLGEGPVRFASGGYGSARVLATGLKRVWAVQYLNSMGTVILDTVEIGDIPSAALACVEDFEDSARRLVHVLKGALQ